jgi:hypothetical protein
VHSRQLGEAIVNLNDYDQLAHAIALAQRPPAVPRAAYPTDEPSVAAAYAADDYEHDHRARLG